jgi:uncharacterized protein with von Willebrand factor type A (vWA) domain
VRVRYDRWSGTQDPFAFAVSADAVLDELHGELLAGGDLQEAIRRLAERGFSGRTAGLDDLRRRVEEARRRELDRMGLDGPLRRVEEQLDAILERERTALAFSADELAGQRLADLDELPRDLAARLAALEERAWEDPSAGADFAALMDELRRDVAEATFGRLAGALGAMGPEDLAATAAMLGELNAGIAKDARGEDVTDDFAAFADAHPDVVGDAETLDELLEELARRMAAMSSLMAGMSPDQRAQLAAMAEQLLGDLDLSFQTDQLTDALRSRFPELGWGQPVPGGMPGGQQDGSLSQTVDWVERLSELGDLGEQLGQGYPGARLDDIDAEALRRSLGDDAVQDLEALREIERVLEESGAAQRRHGRLELTPRGIRRLGEQTLAQVYERAMGGAVGSHRTPAGGGDGELTGSTRALAFGDPFRLDVTRTVGNAILRDGGLRPPAPPEPPRRGVRGAVADRPAAARADRGRGVRLEAGDFELAEAERRVRATTVLLLDMSFSMPLRGNWEPAKRMALALSSLVSSKFPEDRFHIVGFSDYARQLQPRDLLVSGWERVYGTNMQHAFMITRRLLAASPGTEQQIIMVTDGEPTAHLEEWDGGVHATFAWPPEPETLRRTMQEAARIARTGATLNVFLLDHDPGAAQFVEAMVQRVGGRIFYPDLGDLGHLVVRDFLHRRAG